jgi:hypothetical protein
MSYEDRVLHRVPIEILVFSLIIAVAALFVFNPKTSLFVLAGGVFSAASFLWLKQTMTRFLGPDRKKAVRSGLAFYIIRFILIIGIFSIIILLFPRMILAFAAGFSTLILAFMAEAIIGISQMKQWKG